MDVSVHGTRRGTPPGPPGVRYDGVAWSQHAYQPRICSRRLPTPNPRASYALLGQSCTRLDVQESLDGEVASEPGATKADPLDRAAVDLCGVGVRLIH